ncbi:hypothetical protein FIBSPDRAFT_488338 [Athelia psychrophila]|uniref:Uncharacterized protein n=1 Tax=Athelia psychrophila TaxID=1759441 RepID=A0A166KRK3_9AGAM|nr:hypothetical protein FIBSPDRAFT_488338 [Fibularhizoctonia sp. CBS 109695]
MIQALSVFKVPAALTSLCELGSFQKMRIWELMSATLGFLYHSNICFTSPDGIRHTEATHPSSRIALGRDNGSENQRVRLWDIVKVERTAVLSPELENPCTGRRESHSRLHMNSPEPYGSPLIYSLPTKIIGLKATSVNRVDGSRLGRRD